VQCGSRHEDRQTNGMAHFIEHMLFKGTRNRSAFDIASAIDSVGGVMNAFTGK
jgi:predicted Zn-dependent peptidase